MRSILEELWYGNIYPSDGCRKATKENKELMKHIAECHDHLYTTLSEKQKETMEKFDDYYAELIDINEREIFVYAFRLGAKMMMEVISSKDGR